MDFKNVKQLHKLETIHRIYCFIPMIHQKLMSQIM